MPKLTTGIVVTPVRQRNAVPGVSTSYRVLQSAERVSSEATSGSYRALSGTRGYVGSHERALDVSFAGLEDELCNSPIPNIPVLRGEHDFYSRPSSPTSHVVTIMREVVYSRNVRMMGVAIMVWYISSIVLTAINKLVYSAPILHELWATMMFAQSLIMTSIVGVLWMRGKVEINRANLMPRRLATVFLPVALLLGMDVACTNLAYSFIPVSIVVVIKSATASFTYVFCCAFHLEKFHLYKLLSCLLIIVAITAGASDTLVTQHVNYVGIALATVAVVSSAMRWSFCQSVLKYRMAVSGEEQTSAGPLELMLLTQPLMALCLLPVVLIHDIPISVTAVTLGMAPEWWKLGLVCLGGLLAVAVVLSELLIVQISSSTTLCVGGVGKEVLTLILAHMFFSDVLTLNTTIGVGLSLVGIFVYALADFYARKEDSVDIDFETDNEYENA